MGLSKIKGSDKALNRTESLQKYIETLPTLVPTICSVNKYGGLGAMMVIKVDNTIMVLKLLLNFKSMGQYKDTPAKEFLKKVILAIQHDVIDNSTMLDKLKAVKDNNEALIALLQTITNEQQCLVTLAKLTTDSDSWSHYLSSGINPDIPLIYLYQYYRYAINAANDIAGDNIQWANDNSGKLSSRYTWEFNQRGGQQWLL